MSYGGEVIGNAVWDGTAGSLHVAVNGGTYYQYYAYSDSDLWAQRLTPDEAAWITTALTGRDWLFDALWQNLEYSWYTALLNYAEGKDRGSSVSGAYNDSGGRYILKGSLGAENKEPLRRLIASFVEERFFSCYISPDPDDGDEETIEDPDYRIKASGGISLDILTYVSVLYGKNGWKKVIRGIRYNSTALLPVRNNVVTLLDVDRSSGEFIVTDLDLSASYSWDSGCSYSFR